MKVLITSFNQKLGVNPMVNRVFDAMPEFQRSTVEDCEAIFLVFIAPESDFELDAELLDKAAKRDVPVVVFDYTETFHRETFLGALSAAPITGYAALEMLCRQKRLAGYFKRELESAATITLPQCPLWPLDWTLNPAFGDPPIDTREQYNARPIDIFFSWGYSNESRPRLHGELWRQSGRFCAHVCSEQVDIETALASKRERIFALLFSPHYRRIHIKDLMRWQSQAKISISMFGAGKKCFRNCEASYNSLMAQQAPDELQWSYPWVAGKNCIQLPSGGRFHEDRTYEEEVEAANWLYEGLRVSQGSLYDIYVAGVENAKRYQNTRYAREYLLPKLQKALL